MEAQPIFHYQKLRYKRGYIFSDQPVASPNPDWKVIRLNRYWFGYDPVTPFISTQLEDSWGCLLGLIYDLFDSARSNLIILNHLLSKWNNSEENFLNYLDTLSGRFLLILGKLDKVKVFQDASGMRSVFYSTKYPRFSSHLYLLVEHLPDAIIDKRFEGLLDKYTSYHLPGLYTPYQHILSLTPNTYLSLPEQKVKRFFPRQPIRAMNETSLVKDIEALLTSQIDTLIKQHQIIVSLSSGIDSRASLALLRKYKNEILFFTYFKENNNGLDEMNSRQLAIDCEIALDIAKNLDLCLIPLALDYKEMQSTNYEEFRKVLETNTFLHHNHYLSWQYLNKLPSNRLHIRSNVNEIFKGFYRKSRSLPQTISAENMVACYSPKAIGDPFIQICFQNFIETVDFRDFYNYDPYDLFYWEYRLGIWHSSVLLESDVAFDTFCLFNNRWILSKILSLPPSLLKENYILHQLIDRNWPVLNFWPINGISHKPQPLLPSGVDLQSAIIEGISSSNEHLPVYIRKENDQILFFLDVNAPKKDDRVIFTIDLPVEYQQGYLLSFLIQSPYMRRKLQGRMVYEILIDNIMIGSEDVAFWGNMNMIQIAFQAHQPTCKLTVQVRAQRDCEAWNWGAAAKIIIGKINLQKIIYTGLPVATTSSPFTNLSVGMLTPQVLANILFE